MYTVARARGEVVHTPGITSQSPGGDSCARVMPRVGPRWGRPCRCDSPGWVQRFQPVSPTTSGRRRAAAADGTCVRRGSSQHCSQLQDRLPGPPTHDLKAGLHHLSLREAHGPAWSSLGPSLAKSTFGRPTQFGPTLGNWSQVLAYCCFTRPTVHQCCSRGPLLFCCYC